MRNLKKVLTLVLTVAMVLSIMVVGTGAAFSDQDQIKNKEAVDVCTTLNIIAGMEDGSYRPANNVTRAQMCKMICVALNGGKEPTLGTNATPTFSDVRTDPSSSWAESFIESCNSQGIVSGVGGGRFNPSGSVTGTQAARMLLVALGFNAQNEGFTGESWDINVNVRATQKGLYSGLESIDPNAALSRDNAAQMIKNALDATLVTYRNEFSTDANGQIVATPVLADKTDANNKTSTLLEDKYGVVKVEGVVTGNEFTDGSGMAGKTALTVTNYGSTSEQNTFNSGNYNVATGADELGKSITLYVKPYSTNNSSLTRATVVGGVTINENNNVFTTGEALVINSDKSNDITKTLKNEGLKFDGSPSAAGDAVTATVYVNYAQASASDYDTLGEVVNRTGDGIATTFIDNDDDGNVDAITYLVKSFGQVTTVATTGDGRLAVASRGSEGANISTTDAKSDIANFESLGLAKDDYVSYYRVAGSDTYYVEKVDGQTVSVTARKGSGATAEITASGTVYTQSKLANATDVSAESGNQATLADAVSLGKDAVFYLDDYNNVIYVDSVSTTANYLMITGLDDYNTFGGSLQAKVVHQDGTTGTVKIASYKNGNTTWETDTLYKNSGTGAVKAGSTDAHNGSTVLYGGEYFQTALNDEYVYKYSTNSDGEYALEFASSDKAASTPVIKGNASSVAGTTLNSGTIFVVKSGSNWNTYTGIANVPTLTPSTVYYVTDSGNVKVLFVTADNASTNDPVVILDASPVETDDDGSTVYTYNVLYKGEITTLTADNTVRGTISSAGLYALAQVGDGEITSAGVAVTAKEVTVCADGVIATGTDAAGTNGTVYSYSYDDKTVVYVVEDGEATQGDISDITVKETTPVVAGSNVVIVRRGDTGADQYTADYIVVYK